MHMTQVSPHLIMAAVLLLSCSASLVPSAAQGEDASPSFSVVSVHKTSANVCASGGSIAFVFSFYFYFFPSFIEV